MENDSSKKNNPNSFSGLIGLLGKYKSYTVALLLLTILSSIVTLVIPQLILGAIDSYKNGNFNSNRVIYEFALAISLILIFGFGQSIAQAFISESVARDLRKSVADKISRLSYSFIQKYTGAKLLTNLTSDIDNIKDFLSQGVVQLISSIVLIFGSGAFLISLNWQLGLAVIMIIPVLLATFFLIFRQIMTLFQKAQEITDKLNRVITESIAGSALIRVLNSQAYELAKFGLVNADAKDVGTSILRMFASIFPIIGLLANAAILIVLVLGGKFVIEGTLSIGQFSAFMNYISIFIFPVIVLGFISNNIGRALNSYSRLDEILKSENDNEGGSVTSKIVGGIEFKNVSLTLDQTDVLKNISFKIKAGTRVGILGPTAAGKTQLFYLIAGLQQPTSGEIFIDNVLVNDYQKDALYKQLGLVFQDSILFNTTILENISFRNDVNKEMLEKAIDTAELHDYLQSQSNGLDTVLAERGNSLSGGQKQRLTLARALAINPSILLLDDFTARVDNKTEKKIFDNIKANYSGITQLVITQKIASIQDFDEIILMMEGEILAIGKHEDLLVNSFEYKQIFESQQTTE